MAAILNFRIFRKFAKHKNAYISKTVLDRAISTKFLTHRVSLQSSHANFQKNFVSPKMATASPDDHLKWRSSVIGSYPQWQVKEPQGR